MQHLQQPQTQAVSNEEFKKLSQILSDSEHYKEGTKSYKKLIAEKNQHTISVVVETVQRIIVEKQRETPMTQLNALRLAKECFELFVQEFMDQIGEKVLPIMSQIAHFQMVNQKMDRGKEYFVGAALSSGGAQDLQVVGNSFFRLVLECIYVWAKWLPQSQFVDTYQNLVYQNVAFPTSFNYFKTDYLSSIDEILQRRQEQSQIRKMEHESKLKNERKEVKEEGLNEFDSHVHPTDQKQKNHENTKDFGETRTGGGPDKTENDSQHNDKVQNSQNNQQLIDENPVVKINAALKHIQQVKSSLLEGLCKPQDMERSLLQYFHVEFDKFSAGAQEMSQRLLEKNLDGTEDLFGNLFNENEFADLFVKHCDLYLAGRTTWNEFQKPFEIYFKKPQILKNNNNNNGDASTIGEYVSIRMQPNMLASDQNGGNVVAPKTFQTEKQNKNKENLNQINNRDEDNEPEETIKRNLDFTADNHHQNDNSSSKGQQQQPKIYGSEKEKRTLRSAVSSSEVSKYKFQYKSRANFSRLNDSNSSAFNNNLPPNSRFSSNANNNFANDQNNTEELKMKLTDALQSLAEIQKERDSFLDRYNQAQIQLKDLQRQLDSANIQKK